MSPPRTPTREPGAATATGAAPGGAWRAWHLHLDSDARTLQDRVVVDVVRPAVLAVTGPQRHPWFFVRYWHGGPHVRLRVHGLDDEQCRRVEALLVEALAVAGRLQPAEVPLSPDEHARVAAQLIGAGEPGGAQDAALLPAGVHSRPYEPEVERYGGPVLLPAAEQLFWLSSELVARALETAPSTGARAALALRAAATAASALPAGPERQAFAGLGLEAWRAFVGGLGLTAAELDALCRPRSGPGGSEGPEGGLAALTSAPALQPWGQATRAHVARARTATTSEPGRLLFSHVHMLHNRLGLRPVEEVQTYARLVRLVGADGAA